jgi:predicted enzyme related to lactoylglutathione lyase
MQMKVVTEYPNGLFSWVDLSTTNAEGAKAFYGGLFGWEFEDQPMDMDGFYTMCLIDGHNVAGIGSQPPDMVAQGIPPFWSSYIKHDDVDAIAAKINEAGGNLLVPPMDVMQAGRMIMGTDPTGAAFGVWQPRNHIGAAIVNHPNSLVWNELQTNDLDVAITFYSAVFGWTIEVDQNGYVLFSANGRPQAGGMKIEESWGPVPPNWAVYFLVEDVESYTAKAKELGGNVMVPPTVAGEVGKFSVLQDPQGGAFTVMQFNGSVNPPPGH